MSGPLIMPWNGIMPTIADDAFIAPTAVIIGDVVIGSKASIWFGCILRGDVNFIRVGARSNIQDGTVVHVESAKGGEPGRGTTIGEDVLIGHMAMIHGCVLEDRAFVGMSATILNGAVVEGEAMLAAGALLGPNKRVLKGQLWGGTPAKYMRDLNEKELAGMEAGTVGYAVLGGKYREQIAKG